MKKRNKKCGAAESEPRLSERICRYLDITPDGYSGECMIELHGRNYLGIHGSGRILVYTPEEIKIELRKDCLRIRGKRLYCASYYKNSVCIDGQISDISFCEEE